MKRNTFSAWRCQDSNVLSSTLIRMNTVIVIILLSVVLLSSCTKAAVQEPQVTASEQVVSKTGSEAAIMNQYTGISMQTRWELLQARAATAKYKNVQNAKNDGYVDIHVDVQHMGHHYMKPTIVDGTFDLRQPEILVYDDDMNLVAVEYAIPLANPMPQGFSGATDVWDGNTGFGLWLLHAWVWEYNPDGVFHSTNPNVHID
jgi:hypothetical protein